MGIKEHQQRIDTIKDITRNIIISTKELHKIYSMFDLPEIPVDERIKLAEGNLKTIYLSDDYKLVFNEIVEELTYLIPLEDFIIKGILWRAIKKWQIHNNEPFLSAMQNEPTVHLKVGVEILSNARHILSKSIFSRKPEEKKRFLDEVFRKSVELFEELISVMQFLNNPVNQEYIINFEINNWLKGNYSLL